MTLFVTAYSAFGLTVSEAETETMCLQTKSRGKVSLIINAAEQVKKTNDRMCVLGLGHQRRQRTKCRDSAAFSEGLWAWFKLCKTRIYDRRVCARG